MASSTPQPSGDSDIHPPPTIVTSTNQTGIIAILTGFSLGLVLLSTGVRLYARRYAAAYRGDDFVFYIAILIAVVQTCLVFYLVSQGLGKIVDVLSADQVTAIRRVQLASNLLYIIVLFLSKIACALMFVWLTPYNSQKRIGWILFGVSCVWLVTSLFVEGFSCHEYPQQCAGYAARWLYIGAFDIILEVALILASGYMVWNRVMSTRSKWTVFGAFACRVPNIACTVLRLIFINEALTPKSSSYWAARVHSITELAIGYTVTACVIPYLRPLMQAYENPDGTRRRSSNEPNFKLSQRSSKGSVGSLGKLRSLMLTGHTSAGEREPTFSDANLMDVNRLLAPEKAALKRTRSADPAPGMVKTRDWSVPYGHKASVSSPPPAASEETVHGLRKISTVMSAPTVASGVRLEQDTGSFDAGDLV